MGSMHAYNVLYNEILKDALDALSSASVLTPDVEAVLVTLEKTVVVKSIEKHIQPMNNDHEHLPETNPEPITTLEAHVQDEFAEVEASVGQTEGFDSVSETESEDDSLLELERQLIEDLTEKTVEKKIKLPRFTGYQIFIREHGVIVRKDHPGMKPREVNQIIKHVWKETMKETEREVYNHRALEEKAAHVIGALDKGSGSDSSTKAQKEKKNKVVEKPIHTRQSGFFLERYRAHTTKQQISDSFTLLNVNSVKEKKEKKEKKEEKEESKESFS